MSALISWIAAISGKVNSITQLILVPNAAPTCEYVAIPLGSSSEAPVIRPGPRTDQKPLRGALRGARCTAIRWASTWRVGRRRRWEGIRGYPERTATFDYHEAASCG